MTIRPMFTVREGSTDPIIVVLQSIDPDDGTITAVDLSTVLEIELHLRGTETKATKLFDTGDRINIVDAVNGKVSFDHIVGDLVASDGDYQAFFRVTDAAGNDTDFPSDQTAVLEILADF